MKQLFKKIFGPGKKKCKVDLKELVKDRKAQIIDVRSKGEFQGGHVRGSMNIPLDSLASNLSTLRKDKPVITCCASGMRSESAKSILKTHGFAEVHNGGGWRGLQEKIS